MILRRRTIPKRKKVIIMFDTRKFGSFLADLRKSADMTQSELGDRLNLTRQAISRYECGDSFPDISVLGDIARIFGVPVELLISSGDPTVGEAGIINAVASGRDINPQDGRLGRRQSRAAAEAERPLKARREPVEERA